MLCAYFSLKHICVHCYLCKLVKTHTWKQRVLDAEHGRPVSIVHGLHDLLFGYVSAAIFDANPRFQVVEVAAVQLKELDQEYAQVFVGVPGINARVELRNRI